MQNQVKKYLELDSGNLEYTLRYNRRSKNIRLMVRHDGVVMVSVPLRLRTYEHLVERFIREKSDWINKQKECFGRSPRTVLIENTQKNFALYKAQALALARERVAYFNALYHFTFGVIKIKNQTTRWGSCSKKGNLSFNYRILLLPERIRDYIIVHELCHTREFNHSKKFWQLVERAMPDHPMLRKALRMRAIS